MLSVRKNCDATTRDAACQNTKTPLKHKQVRLSSIGKYLSHPGNPQPVPGAFIQAPSATHTANPAAPHPRLLPTRQLHTFRSSWIPRSFSRPAAARGRGIGQLALHVAQYGIHTTASRKKESSCLAGINAGKCVYCMHNDGTSQAGKSTTTVYVYRAGGTRETASD